MGTHLMRRAAPSLFAVGLLGLAACGSDTTVLQSGPLPTARPTLTPGPATPAPVGTTPTPVATPTSVATPTPVATATLPGTTPTPVSTATATATAVASPSAITVAPTPLSFNATGYDLTFAANDPGYTGALSAASSDCSGIATFSPSSANGPNATFTVASVGPGTCHVNIADTLGNTTAETVIVTTTTGTINLRRH